MVQIKMNRGKKMYNSEDYEKEFFGKWIKKENRYFFKTGPVFRTSYRYTSTFYSPILLDLVKLSDHKRLNSLEKKARTKNGLTILEKKRFNELMKKEERALLKRGRKFEKELIEYKNSGFKVRVVKKRDKKRDFEKYLIYKKN